MAAHSCSGKESRSRVLLTDQSIATSRSLKTCVLPSPTSYKPNHESDRPLSGCIILTIRLIPPFDCKRQLIIQYSEKNKLLLESHGQSESV